MNFSRLMKTMAFVGLVGFGSQVLADMGGDDLIGGDTFEDVVGVVDYEQGLFGPQTGGTDWTADANDKSELVTGFVTAFGPMPDCGGYANEERGMLLDLDTDGNDLTFAAASTELATVYVDTMLRVIGSADAPEITDGTVQTAVYLDTDDGNLYGYGTVGGVNAWVKLDDVSVEDEEWICLRIEIDYKTGFGVQTPYATVYVNDEPAGDAYVVANRLASFAKRSISSVSFRGTGMVDNFTVSETPRELELATIITRSVDASGTVIGSLTDDPGVEYIIDATPTVQYSNEFEGIDGQPQYILRKVELLASDGTTVIKTLAAIAEVDITTAEGFVDDATYYVQATYAETRIVTTTYTGDGAPANPSPATVNYNGTFTLDLDGVVALDGDLSILVPGTTYGPGGDGEIFYDSSEIVDGVLTLANVTSDLAVGITGTFGSSGPDIDITDNDTLTFSNIVFGATTSTVGFTAEGTVTASPAVMYLIASTNLALGASGEFPIEVNVTAAAGTPPAISGSIAIDSADLTGYDSFFIKGLGTEP